MERIFPFLLRDLTIKDILAVAINDKIAPLYYVLIGYMSKSFSHELILGFMLLLNFVVVIMIICFANYFGGYRAGLLSGFIATFSPFMIYCSISPRYENISMIFAILSLWSCYSLLNVKTNKKNILVYFLSSLFGLFSHYYFLYLLLFQNVYFLFFRKKAIIWLSIQMTILLAFAIWMSYSFNIMNFSEDGNTIQAINYIAVFSMLKLFLLKIFAVLASFNSGAYYPIFENTLLSYFIVISNSLLILFLLVDIYRKVISKMYSDCILYLSFTLFTVLLLVFIFNQLYGFLFSSRHVVHIYPAWCICIGLVLTKLDKKLLYYSMMLCVLLSFIIGIHHFYLSIYYPDHITLEYVLNEIDNREQDSDIILVTPSYYQVNVAYHFEGTTKQFGLPHDYNIYHADDYFANNISDIKSRLSTIHKYKRIWLLAPYISERNALLLNTIITQISDSNYYLSESRMIYGDVMPKAEGKIFLFEKIE